MDESTLKKTVMEVVKSNSRLSLRDEYLFPPEKLLNDRATRILDDFLHHLSGKKKRQLLKDGTDAVRNYAAATIFLASLLWINQEDKEGRKRIIIRELGVTSHGLNKTLETMDRVLSR